MRMKGSLHTSVSSVSDPLKDFIGRPILPSPPSKGEYLGRAVLELWEGDARMGIDGVAQIVDTVDGDAPGFLKLVIPRMNAGQALRVQDVLSPSERRPVMSGAGDSTFAGRVVVEAWRLADSDTYLVISTDGSSSDSSPLVRRVTEALGAGGT